MATINYNDPWIQQKAQQQFGNSLDDTFASGRQGALEWVLFGENADRAIAELDKQAKIAGLPEDFDWTPHLVSTAQNHWSQYNQPFRHLESPIAGIVAPAFQSAAASNPELADMAEAFAPGSDYWNKSVAEQQSLLAKHKASEGLTKRLAWTAALGMIGAGAAAGAGSGGAAAGGSGSTAAGTGAAAGGSGAAGAGTAAGGTASGLTASEWAAGLSSSELAGGAAAAGTAASAGGGGAATAGSGSSGSIDIGANMAAAETGAGTAASNFSNSSITAGSSSTALQRILDGNGTSADYLQLFGQVAPSLLGMYASDKQADKLGAQAARYEAMGAPYRDRLAGLYSDPTAFLNSPEVKIPVQQGTDALARALSTQGNPAGSGAALQQLQSYASDQLFSRLGQEKDRLGGFGGLTQYQAAAPGLGANAINAQRGYYDALGYGVGQVTNPPRSLEDMLKAYNTSQGLS